MESIVTTLLMWIATHSPYPVANLPPPAVVLMTAERLAAMLPPPAADAAPIPPGLVHGLFLAGEGPHGTIYVVRPEDTPRVENYPVPSDNPVFRERLLHELVHYAQHVTGEAATWRCPSQGEYRAYLMGGAYLRESNVRDPLPNRRFAAFVATGC